MGVTDDSEKAALGVSLLSLGEDQPDIGDADYDDEYIEDGYDLDDALEIISNGPFQCMLVFCIFLAWSFNSMLTMVTPFFISGMRKEMGLSATQEGVTAAAVLLGFIGGNVGWGMMSDKFGRRIVIMICVLGAGVFNSLAAFGMVWWHIAALRVGVGFFIAGSMVPSNSLVSELVPRSSRGRWLVLLHVSWQIGTLTMVGVSYHFRGEEGWRTLMLAMGAPSILILGFMLALGLPESPRYLLLMKRRAECIEVLERAAYMNNRSLPNDTQLMDIPPHPTVRPLKEIFNASLFARTTLPLWAMFFWLNYAAYGLSMWLKAYLGKLGMDEVVRDLYIWLSIGKILGLLVCASVIEHLPRRRTLGVAFFMSGVCTFAAVMVHGGEELVADYAIHISGSTLVLFLFSAAAFFEEAAWGTMYTYSVEVYPSSIRSTGSGAAMAFGRFGGIIATSIGKKLMQEDPRLPFYIVSLAFLLATVAVGVSRVETKGAKLADLS